MDDLGRLTSTREGELVSGSISTGGRTREERWTTLSPTGNWKRRKLDLNGDGDYSDTGELDDTATFNPLTFDWRGGPTATRDNREQPPRSRTTHLVGSVKQRECQAWCKSELIVLRVLVHS